MPLKILIITSQFTPTLSDHKVITNGLDAIVVKSLPILKAKGHDVHVAVAGTVDQYWSEYCTPHILSEVTSEMLVGKGPRLSLTISYQKAAAKLAAELKPDFVWNHTPNPNFAATIAKDFPTTHHIHQLNMNSMYMIGRLIGQANVIENGGSVYCSDFVEKLGWEIVDDFMQRTGDERKLNRKTMTHSQFVNTPLDERFLTQDIKRTDSDVPLMIGRYDEKFVDKNIHLVDKLGIEIDGIVSGYNKKIWDQFAKSKNHFYYNISRDSTIDEMKSYDSHIIGCVYESVSIVNYEMMCCGSTTLALSMREDLENAATSFSRKINEIRNLKVHASIPWKSPNLKERLQDAISDIGKVPYDEKVYRALTARSALSHDKWYEELMSTVPGGTK